MFTSYNFPKLENCIDKQLSQIRNISRRRSSAASLPGARAPISRPRSMWTVRTPGKERPQRARPRSRYVCERDPSRKHLEPSDPLTVAKLMEQREHAAPVPVYYLTSSQ